MNTYKMKLTQTGLMTAVPDSQRIFGWLMHQLTERYGKQKISELVGNIHKGETACMISNLLPDGYYPMPQTYFLQRQLLSNENHSLAGKEEQSKHKYNILKKMDYVREKSLEALCKGADLEDKNLDYLTKSVTYLQKIKISSNFHNMPGRPNEMYSVPVVSIQDPKGISCCQYYLLLQTADPMICQWIEEQQQKQGIQSVFLGARASQGFNAFRLERIEKQENREKKQIQGNQKNRWYLNIGMLLPRHILYRESFLEIYTSARRPYLNTRYATNETDETISFIQEGSIVASADSPHRIGKCIDNPFNIHYQKSIVFGQSYLVPFGGI